MLSDSLFCPENVGPSPQGFFAGAEHQGNSRTSLKSLSQAPACVGGTCGWGTGLEDLPRRGRSVVLGLEPHEKLGMDM